MEPQVSIPLRKLQDMEYQIASLNDKVDLVVELLQSRPEVKSPDKLIGKKEACEYLGIKQTRLDAFRRCGKLEFVRVGGLVKFKVEDLDRFIDRMKAIS